MNFPWRGKKVLIFGLGTLGGGVGVAKFFAEAAAKVTVTDLKPSKELATSLAQLKKFKNIRYVLGKHNEGDFKTHDLIIKNPAVPAESPYLAIAKSAKIPIEMEASLFFLLSSSKNIIGVTGTKGKTTTTTLIAQILQEAEYPVVVAGIPKHSILEQVKKVKPQTWVVLELSSWQLESLSSHKISPHIAIMTNVFKDHLNRYKTFEDYILAKKIIFEFQKKNDFFITSKDFELTRKLAKTAKSQVVFFAKNTLPQKISQVIQLPGEHNLANVSCSYRVGKIFGIPDRVIISVIKKFKGIPGRLEVFKRIDGVTFVNDTTATIPDATTAALSAFAQPVILICGGADKELDFSSLVKVINQKVKAVVLLEGTATDKIEREVKEEKILGRFSDFKRAINIAFRAARKGDVILLSPATASFGMFKNEFDRGKQFRREVTKLTKRLSD